MTWGKMDDKFHRNKKVRALRQKPRGREALGVWVYWWSWTLDDPELNGIVPSVELSSADLQCAQLLVDVGLWDVVEDGYSFHDFHAYNPTKKQVEDKRAYDRDRKSTAAKPSDVPDSDVGRKGIPGDSGSDSDRIPAGIVPPARVPSRPVPSPNSQSCIPSPDGASSVPLVGVASDAVAHNHQAEPRIGADPAESELEPGEPEPEAKFPRHETYADQVKAALKQAYPGKMPELYGQRLGAAVAHVRGLAEEYGKPPREIIPALCAAAEPARDGWEFRIATKDPFKPAAPARASPASPKTRLTPTKGTTEKDTEHVPDEATQLAALEKHWGNHGRA